MLPRDPSRRLKLGEGAACGALGTVGPAAEGLLFGKGSPLCVGHVRQHAQGVPGAGVETRGLGDDAGELDAHGLFPMSPTGQGAGPRGRARNSSAFMSPFAWSQSAHAVARLSL